MSTDGMTPTSGAVAVLDAAFTALYCSAEDDQGKALADAVFVTGIAIEEFVQAAIEAESTIAGLKGLARAEKRQAGKTLQRLRAARAAVVAPSEYFTQGARHL